MNSTISQPNSVFSNNNHPLLPVAALSSHPIHIHPTETPASTTNPFRIAPLSHKLPAFESTLLPTTTTPLQPITTTNPKAAHTAPLPAAGSAQNSHPNSATSSPPTVVNPLPAMGGNTAAASTTASTGNTAMPVINSGTTDESLAGCESPLKWIKGELIGEGTFGKVYKGLNEKTGQLLAIKQFLLVDESEEELENLCKEIHVMWSLNHENIVRYVGTTRTTQYLFIILEYITGGSIEKMIKSFGSFSENLIR